MRVFVENYNGVLDTVIDTLHDRNQYTDNPHEADAFLLWQDIRGVPSQLAQIAKEQLKKPVIVMQHGRGATRDYGQPNNFKLIADKILVWGATERQRMIKNGYSDDRIEVVGCPMIQRLRPKSGERNGKNVLFVPVISSKEEPENILVYAALKKWESEQLIKTIYAHFNDFKRAWAWEQNEFKETINPDGTKERRLWNRRVSPTLPRWVTYASGLVNVKVSGVHDMHQYLAPIIASQQNDPNLIDGLIDLLGNTDVMVCLEEGTMQLLAHALNIPVIVVDIFKYENYGGCKDYDKVEKILTKACYQTRDISKIGGLVDHALKFPNELQKHRIRVCEEEGGANLGDINERIINAIKSVVKEPVAA